jgi:arginase
LKSAASESYVAQVDAEGVSVKDSLLLTETAARAVDIIGAACGRGAKEEGSRFGPEALKRYGLEARLQAEGIRAWWRDDLEAAPAVSGVPALAAITDLADRLADRAAQAVGDGGRLAVLGGDHSVATGTWRGVARALRPRGPTGLVWIDAHMDSHTFETTPSGAIHGMPLAALLGHGTPALIGDGPALRPEHVSLVGVRSFEPGEAELLQRLGVRIYFIDEVNRRGLKTVLDEAADRASAATAGFGLSLDLDAIDPAEAPGVSCFTPNGLRAGDMLCGLKRIGRRPGLVAVEITEYNPAHDRADITARLTCDLLSAVFSPGETAHEQAR